MPDSQKNAIFIGATGQHVGKSTTCLGIISGLQKLYSRVGFIKPIGQQHVTVPDGSAVDKDVVLFREHFNLDTDYKDMSPVIVPSGFTREYLDGKISSSSLQANIKRAFQNINTSNGFTVVEGTGHLGVGSIIGLDNARIAALLGLEMIIIVSGGLGSSFDELALNLALCEKRGVKIRGVILNRVIEDKRAMILEYYQKALATEGIPLIGAIPFNMFLSTPTIADFEVLLNAPLLAGIEYRLRHFKGTRVVAGSLDSYHDEVLPSQLIITPASREDVILATLERHKSHIKTEGTNLKGGMILTGRRPPHPDMIETIQRHNVPILYAAMTSYEVMRRITTFTAKTAKEDVRKVGRAIKLVEEHLDFDIIAGKPIDTIR
ncbi:Uncharacterized protein SCG7086_AS_00220 [Chlamydiales bacterium SCGC AG-110-P3]|nr:Uncharacterized protein SCG7086_AS_00220 [Chlamydiales bacterium SCGC AG-110-P3]